MKTDYVEPGSYARLLSAMTWPNALAVRVALETGLRIGDVLSARERDLQGDWLTGKAHKTGKPYRFKLQAQTARDLRWQACNGWLFPGRDPRRPRTRQAVWKDMKQAAARVRLEGVVRPHSARKTFAVEKRKRDGIEATMAALQHEKKWVTEMYAYADVGMKGVDLDALAVALADRLTHLLLDRK